MSLLETPGLRDPRGPNQHRASHFFGRFLSRGACALVLLGCGTKVDGAAQPGRVRVQFGEVNTLFANLGQGWMSQQRTPPEPPRFPYSVVYVRFNWADAEPEEGRYNWALIDDNIGRVPPEAMPALEELARRAGARLLLREVAHPATGHSGDSLPIEMQWANVGVGKLHRAWGLRVELIDGNHQVAVSTAAPQQADFRQESAARGSLLPISPHIAPDRPSGPAAHRPGRGLCPASKGGVPSILPFEIQVAIGGLE